MFDLKTAAGWDALASAFRSADAAAAIAGEEFTRAERAAQADPDSRDVAPSETHSDALARVQHNNAIRERHGLPGAQAREACASDARFDLVWAALAAPAPNRNALALKLEMISDPMGYGDLDNETWPILLADVRRFALNQEESRP